MPTGVRGKHHLELIAWQIFPKGELLLFLLPFPGTGYVSAAGKTKRAIVLFLGDE